MRRSHTHAHTHARRHAAARYARAAPALRAGDTQRPRKRPPAATLDGGGTVAAISGKKCMKVKKSAQKFWPFRGKCVPLPP